MRNVATLTLAVALLTSACGEKEAPAPSSPKAGSAVSDDAATPPPVPPPPQAPRRPSATAPTADEVETFLAVAKELASTSPLVRRTALASRDMTEADWEWLRERVASALARVDAGESTGDPLLAPVASRQQEIREALRAGPSGTARPLTRTDVADYIAIMNALGTAEDKAATLEAMLEEREIERAWWDEMSARITAVASVARIDRDAPVPATFAADHAVIEPFRARVEAAIAR